MKPYSPIPLFGVDVVIGMYLKQRAEARERRERDVPGRELARWFVACCFDYTGGGLYDTGRSKNGKAVLRYRHGKSA